ncbi:MAG: hypothetical protein PCFJNLEI_02772 [Verrucomicrobiae bacterium]|nr:hypothetical protein [Verrucomicrobiae bacterium]
MVNKLLDCKCGVVQLVFGGLKGAFERGGFLLGDPKLRLEFLPALTGGSWPFLGGLKLGGGQICPAVGIAGGCQQRTRYLINN